VLVDDATYFRDPANGISYGLKLINQQQYNGIAVKTVTSTYPQVLWINMSYPNIEMYVYPVPTRALEFHIVSVDELSTPANLGCNYLVSEMIILFANIGDFGLINMGSRLGLDTSADTPTVTDRLGRCPASLDGGPEPLGRGIRESRRQRDPDTILPARPTLPP
jgi:hypothetical protein